MVEELKCRECGSRYPAQPLTICENCFGPLEVTYDYAQIVNTFTSAAIEARPKNMWRYKELLPGKTVPAAGAAVGFTPLIREDKTGC